jgi:hypothetical protein
MNAIALSNPKIRIPSVDWQHVLDLLVGLVFVITHGAAIRTVVADAVVDAIDAGAGVGNLIFQTSGAAEVATLPMSDPAFGNADGAGTATANAITDDTNATGGTTDRFVIQDSNAVTVILGSVATSGEDINLSSVAIGVGDTVSVSALTYTAMP